MAGNSWEMKAGSMGGQFPFGDAKSSQACSRITKYMSQPKDLPGLFLGQESKWKEKEIRQKGVM